MGRFYENLLRDPSRPGGPSATKLAALSEAQRWLRELTREELDRLRGSVADAGRSERGITVVENSSLDDDRPFAHPYYWAAFVLLGDPDRTEDSAQSFRW